MSRVLIKIRWILSAFALPRASATNTHYYDPAFLFMQHVIKIYKLIALPS